MPWRVALLEDYIQLSIDGTLSKLSLEIEIHIRVPHKTQNPHRNNYFQGSSWVMRNLLNLTLLYWAPQNYYPLSYVFKIDAGFHQEKIPNGAYQNWYLRL